MLDFILDWIYPPRCMICDDLIPIDGPRWICPRCDGILEAIPFKSACQRCGRPLASGDSLCGDCNGKRFHFEKNSALYEYDEVTSFLIHKFKYGGHSGMGKGLGALMAKNIDAELLAKTDYLVPVPMYPAKERERGFNQAALLSREISRRTGKKTVTNLIFRNKNTKAQRFLNPREREKNIRGAFSPGKNKKYLEEFRGKSFLLIDDIYTTGSTINACAEILKSVGASSVNGYTLSIAIRKK